ncbi:hypothetical protein [Bremerella cremea]|uniref:hypothetical protein n=1 Tax=Bremerella cremea TaxID=1031537 RepID=UPI0031E71603
MRRLYLPGIALLLCMSGLSSSLLAEDHFLTIGGGPTADGNQVSLENNVLYFQRTLNKLGLNQKEHQILFADGNDPGIDLQVENPDRGPEDLRRMLAEIVGPSTGIRFDYRSSSIEGISGAARPEVIEERIKELSNRLTDGDRLILYFTGHGGRERPAPQRRSSRSGRPTAAIEEDPKEASDDSDNKEESAKEEDSSTEDDKKEDDNSRSVRRRPSRPTYVGNHTHLWHHKTMTVPAWAEKLDQLPPDMPVVVVMVQCYSGGFGNLIFEGGEPKNGLTSLPRCGFFSTVPDRVAAGCTPNVDQAEYREYSSYFWEALSGTTRTGQIVAMPDYDNDGQTSLLEAHAYTVLTADTIDIPTRTSDFFLQQLSSVDGDKNLLTIHTPVELLLAEADPCERAVIEGLSQHFGLSEQDRGKEVDEAIRNKRSDKRKVDGDVRRKQQTINGKRGEIKRALQERWPEIVSPWHPKVAQMIADEPATLEDFITKHKAYGELTEVSEELHQLQTDQEQLEVDIVKLERLKYWLERRALALNLPLVADEKSVDQLKRLVELESQKL